MSSVPVATAEKTHIKIVITGNERVRPPSEGGGFAHDASPGRQDRSRWRDSEQCRIQLSLHSHHWCRVFPQHGSATWPVCRGVNGSRMCHYTLVFFCFFYRLRPLSFSFFFLFHRFGTWPDKSGTGPCEECIYAAPTQLFWPFRWPTARALRMYSLREPQPMLAQVRFMLTSCTERGDWPTAVANIFLAGLKADLVNERCISREEAKAAADTRQFSYYECSSKTGEGVRELFLGVANQVRGVCQQGELENGFKHCHLEFISEQEFFYW